MGKSEEACRLIFQTRVHQPFIKCRPYFLGKLELDGYCRKHELAFEYQGIQHYQFHPYFHKSYQHFEQQLERDERKQILCHRYGLILMTVPHQYTFRTIRPMSNYIMTQLIQAEQTRGECYIVHKTPYPT